jgi:hypothetical protein
MKSRILSLMTMVGALLAAGCQTRAPQEVVIQLTSATSVSYSGTVTVDGKQQEISGRTPTELRYQASRIDCQVKQGTENGTLTIEVMFPEQPDALESVTASTGPNTLASGSVVVP